ncbi:hypothetical protein F5B21DRAFT_491323 [Xylaria acuta]|nr:hypothetical protein F5B21DRAFT_491323 [Xylaria acuta]
MAFEGRSTFNSRATPRRHHLIEQETRSSQLLEGSELAPRFLGHINQRGRVMGSYWRSQKGTLLPFKAWAYAGPHRGASRDWDSCIGM